MAATGFTPIQLYYSTTASAAPSSGNLANGELAINITDGKLYYKDNGGTVRVLAGTGGTGVVAGSNTQVQFNNNGVFGASSGLTFDGTTLTANALTVTNATTLSAGTANGVPYLNASKVLTTGSALTFTGANLGVGIATALQRVHIYESAAATGAFLQVQEVGGQNAYFGVNTSGGSIQVTGANPLQFAINGSEQMRLTSTGLGIGTSSPQSSAKLHVYATGDYTDESAPFTLGNSAVGGMRLYSGVNNTGEYSYIGSVKSGTRYANLVLQPNGGNLGLGVTPSAWGSGTRGIDIGSGSAIWNPGSGTQTQLLNNSYNNGTNFIYKNDGSASRYRMVGNAHEWYTAPSGTAGAAISFTQAMTLDASGNLLIGATSGSNKLTVNGNGIFLANGEARFADAGNNQIAYIKNSGAANTSQLEFWTGATPTERARIDSSGNLLVGTTNTAVGGFQFSPDYNSAGSSAFVIGHASGSASGAFYGVFRYGASTIGSITQNGTTGVLYNITSDYRLKNNPTALTGAKEFVMALQPKTWDWWDGSGKGVGFIAHEFMEVAKYSGNGEKDAVDADGNPVYQSIQPSSSEVMANLVALLQEQQAIIEQLKADVAALKGAA